jgi:hypothetical protein
MCIFLHVVGIITAKKSGGCELGQGRIRTDRYHISVHEEAERTYEEQRKLEQQVNSRKV